MIVEEFISFDGEQGEGEGLSGVEDTITKGVLFSMFLQFVINLIFADTFSKMNSYGTTL